MDLNKESTVRESSSGRGTLCCLKCSKRSSFQHVIDIDNLGITVLRYVTDILRQVPHAEDELRLRTIQDQEGKSNIFILINSINNKITSEDICTELDVKKIQCPRCRYRAEKVLKFLPNKVCLRKGDIKGICDHCRNEQFSQKICSICEETVKKFREEAGGQENIQKENVPHSHRPQIVDSIIEKYRQKKEVLKSETDVNLYLKSIIKSKPGLHKPILVPPKQLVGETKPIVDENKKYTSSMLEFSSDESVVTSFITTFSKNDELQDKSFKYIFPKDKLSEIMSKPVEATSSTLLLSIQEKQQRQKIQYSEAQSKITDTSHKFETGWKVVLVTDGKQESRKSFGSKDSLEENKKFNEKHLSLTSTDTEIKITKGIEKGIKKTLSILENTKSKGITQVRKTEDKPPVSIQKPIWQDSKYEKAEDKDFEKAEKNIVISKEDKAQKDVKKLPVKDKEKKAEVEMPISKSKLHKDIRDAETGRKERDTMLKGKLELELQPKSKETDSVEKKAKTSDQNEKKPMPKDSQGKKDEKILPVKEEEKKAEVEKPISKKKLEKDIRDAEAKRKERVASIKEKSEAEQQQKLKEMDNVIEKQAKISDRDEKKPVPKDGKGKKDVKKTLFKEEEKKLEVEKPISKNKSQKDIRDAEARRKEREAVMKKKSETEQQPKLRETDSVMEKKAKTSNTDEKKPVPKDSKGKKEEKKLPVKEEEKKTEVEKPISKNKLQKDIRDAEVRRKERDAMMKKKSETEQQPKLKETDSIMEKKAKISDQNETKLKQKDTKYKKNVKKIPVKEEEKNVEKEKQISKIKLQKDIRDAEARRKGREETRRKETEAMMQKEQETEKQEAEKRETDSAIEKRGNKSYQHRKKPVPKDGKNVPVKDEEKKMETQKSVSKASQIRDAQNRRNEREKLRKEAEIAKQAKKQANKASQVEEKIEEKDSTKIKDETPVKDEKEIKPLKGDLKEDKKEKGLKAPKPEFDILKLIPAKKEQSQVKNKNPLEAIKLAEKRMLDMEQAFNSLMTKELSKRDSLAELAKRNEYNLLTITATRVPQSNIRVPRSKLTMSALALKNLKTKGPSYDHLVLKTVKIGLQKKRKSSQKIQHVRTGKYKIRSAQRYYSSISADSDLELAIESLVHLVTVKDIRYKIKNTSIVKNIPELEQSKFEPDPILFHKKYDAEDLVKVYDIEEESSSTTSEDPKGVLRYALSNRTFIDKGWTVLPVVKVVRKMNIYKVRPAKPEFNWFSNNKKKGILTYDTGEILAQIDENGCGKWFYRNGRVALDYYDSEDTHAQQRFVIYSSGEQDERCRSLPVTVLAMFDYLGNGLVFDHNGKIRIKYNQTEGVILDSGIGPTSRWKWHTLNDPPELKQVMIDTQVDHPYKEIINIGGPENNKREDDETMLAIEFDNFIKQKSQKLKRKFKPYQIKMKSLKINRQFSLKILDQARVYLYFRDGQTNIKLNLGMILDHQEIIDTETADVSDVATCIEQFPPKTESLLELQVKINKARQCDRDRNAMKIRTTLPESSAENFIRYLSKPVRLPPAGVYPHDDDIVNCHRKPPKPNLYYETRLI